MKRLTKSILSVILSILMVITVIPASVLPAVAEESAVATKGAIKAELSLAAGESYEYTVDLTAVDKTKNLVLAFNAHQPTAADGSKSDNAVLSVNGNRTLRVTTGGGMHIWDEGAYGAVDGSTQWEGYTSAQDVTVTVDFANKVINFVYNNRNIDLTSLDLSGDTLTFKFGGANTTALTVKNIRLEYELKSDYTLYTNNFDIESDVTSGIRDDTTNVKFGVDSSGDSVLHISHNNWNYANAYWETSVETNGTDGNIILKTTFDADAVQTVSGSTASGAILTVNGKVIVQNTVLSDNSNRYTITLGGKTEINGCTSGKEEVTLVINSETGIATMYFEQNEASAEYPKLTIVEGIELGKIEETISVRYGSNRHPDFYVYSLSVTQYEGEVIVVPSTLLELGETEYKGWENAKKDEYIVKTNDTNGNVTIVFTPKNNNWQTEGKNLLSVNGVSLVSTCGTDGNAGYYLGTTAVKTWNTNVITAVINPHTGAAIISDSAGNSGTANVAVFHDSFVMVVNDLNHNSWTLSSIVITQDKGEEPTALYTNNFDSAEDVARGTCGNENTVYNENKSALHISYVGEHDYSNAYWETSVKTNGTDGLITLKTTIDADANSHPAATKATGAILTVNGQVVIKNKEGGKFVTLRDGTEIKGCAANYIEEISLIINPENGRATLIFDQTAANAVDGSYPKTVVVENVALGAIGETFSVRYGTNRHANFYVYSLSVSQESGGGYDMHTCEYTTTVTDATCTTPEFTKTECLECGLFTEPVTSPVLGHKWGSWSKNDGVATRSCSVCGVSQSKTVKDVDTTKPLLALGDSLTYALNVEGTINGSWAKYVSDNLGVSSYQNYAVHGTEVYQWYSLLTGEAAPNGGSTAEIAGLTKDTLTEKIKNAGVVAFSLGSNDLIGGYVGHRSAEKVHETLIKIVDKIHEINPDAIVVSVGYAYGVSMVVGGIYEPSYELFIDFNDLMTETLNSEAYNSFAYYVDVSNVMSDVTLLGEDKVHPTAEGQKKIADRAIKATDALNKSDTVVWEGVPTYVNNFDGTAPTAGIVAWGETGTDGVLTVAPSTTIGNTLNVGSSAFPGKSVITFKFNIPKLPESGSINIFHDRALGQNYICVFSKVNEETQKTEFWASVGNENAGNATVKIEEDIWYNVTILFAENADSFSGVYVNNTFVGTVKGTVIGRGATWGFANFSGCDASGNENAATYRIDDFTASAVADEAIVSACGIQRTETLEMKYDVRFVFSVKDIYSDESQIGMDVVVDYGDESKTKNDIETNIVFEKIEDNYGKETITAAELGGKYIATIIVDDVPADYPCVKFVVSPYALINGVKYYADTMTVTLYSHK